MFCLVPSQLSESPRQNVLMCDSSNTRDHIVCDSHPVWVHCSSSIVERTDCGNLSHSRAVRHAQRSSWSRSPLDSVCTQSVQGAMCGPWQSPPTNRQVDGAYSNHHHIFMYEIHEAKRLTCPTIGLQQAPHTPLATVCTPSLLRSDCRLPSILSSLLTCVRGPPGPPPFP